jgi:peptide/nickel transport system substrate-binding protein
LDKLAPPVARPASPVAQPPAPAARWSPAPQEKASPPSGLVFAGQLNAPAAPSRAVQPGAWLAIGGVVGLLALCGLAVLAVLAFRPGGWLTPKAITQVVVVVKTTAPAGVDLGTPMPVTETAADVIVTERPAVTLTPGLPVDTPLPTPSPMPTFTPEPTRVTRAGAWVDRVVFTAIEQADQAVAQLQSNDLDIYAYTVADPNLFRAVANDADLAYSRSLGSYTELSFNPSGPQFEDGRLNPFAVPAIREAVNWLIDRDYLAQEIYGGLARPRFLPTNTSFADYVRYIDVARELENYYAYDFNKASTTIATEMKKLGASQSAGKWRYGGNPVTLIFIIRTEDNRRQIGDYMANQLEAVGFTVDRQYKTRSEASPIWNRSDPRAGQWHIYTGGWVTTAISRDDGTNFGYFYTNLGSGSPLWQAYVNTSEFYDVAKKLWNNDFSSLAERDALFRTALRLCMQDSTRVWLVDQLSFSPHRAGLDVAYDLAGGIAGTQLWPFTLRFNDQEGGTVRIAQPGVLIDPWNPVGGSNWIYDTMPRRATEDYAIIADPYTGLSWPQRLERATVVAQTGLPIVQTLPWLDLSFQGQITVPTDAWADWDAANQRFITVGEAYGSNQTVKVKYTVYYPSDLFETVTWHDGSPLSMGDFILNMIMTFDRAKPESAIYDESAVPAYEAFTSVFKGLKIVSTDPLVIETYSDYYSLDAENSLYTWWPQYGYGQAPWHTVALGIRAEEAQLVTFSADKADALKETNGAIEWLSFISGPSLDILDAQLSTAAAQSYIPYKSVMGQYVSNSAAAARYKNLQTWYRTHGHFWIGTGPFYLDKTYPVEQTLTLARYPGYPDLADKWLRFGVPMIAEVELDGPSQVTIGAQASVDVFISFQGETYPTDQIDAVKYLLFDAQGALAATGAAELSDGRYVVTLPASLTAGLQAGAHRLEVAVTSKVVSIPTFTSFEFFTVP